MEYLVTMTTHVPEETSAQAVDDVRAREAAHSRELAGQGHLVRIWALPGDRRGLYRARDEAEMQQIVASLPLRRWMSVQITPLTEHPGDPAIAGQAGQARQGAGR